MKQTLIVNILAGSGAGKSTTSAKLFAMLKECGYEVELAPEYAKDLVWEGRSKVFECQPYIFGKQLYKLVRLQGCVNIVITDSPILLSAIYDPDDSEDFRKFVIMKFKQFNNINFFLNRIHKFNPNGRNEKTEGEAKANDRRLMKLMDDNGIEYDIVDPNDDGCRKMVERIVELV